LFLKPGQRVPDDLPLEVTASQTFVGRGGLKLDHALDEFVVDPSGRVCADIGASTGGFTDCLLQRGAERVYAIDVGYGQLDWRLRNDPRVVVMERINARYLESLPEPVSLVVMDVSFISLRAVMPAVQRLIVDGGDVVALVKPQFEAGKGRVGKGGIVRDPEVHRDVLTSFASWLSESGQELLGVIASPIRGAEGNVEFLAHLRLCSDGAMAAPSSPGLKELPSLTCEWIERALDQAQTITAGKS